MQPVRALRSTLALRVGACRLLLLVAAAVGRPRR
jgi:hypothetical protein